MSLLFFSLPIMMIPVTWSITPCPDQSTIHPCRCHVDVLSGSTVECSDFDNYDDLQKVFDNLLDYTFDTLILERCTVQYLNSSWFRSTGIGTLYLDNVTSVDLLDDEDVDIPSMTSLEMVATTIMRGLRWRQFRAFSRLNSLTLNEVEVRMMNDFKDDVSNHLGTLVVQSARVTSLSEETFEGKTELSVIAFPYNRIRVLHKSMFKDQRSVLVFLDFSYNPIKHVPEDLFYGMDSLITIKLEGSHLKTLSKIELKVGKYLGFKDNPFVCDCKMSWIPERSRELELDGTCKSPPFLKSKQLRDLSTSDFIACKKHFNAMVTRTVEFLERNELKSLFRGIIVYAVNVFL